LGEFCGEFFPSVAPAYRDTYLYPLPLSAEFCRMYAENVDQALTSARQFAQSIRRIGRGPEQKEEFDEAMREMQALAAQSSFTTAGKAGETFRWAPASLLSYYAAMALADVAEDLLNVCDNCHAVFVSSAGRARFCSPRCRKTALQREWRTRKAMRAAGQK
jgi:hypothetical protein